MIKVTASGHLAADAQLRTFTTQDGRSFTRLSGRVVSSGRGQNASPVGISFTITNEKRAQALAGILRKGLAVTIHGDFNERKSPDGRYLLFTVANYGTFPIWHRETDLHLMDLRTGRIDTLAEVNSNRSDTYHSWSSDSRWFAFASKRGDGQYGRVYLAYVDTCGKAHKPFVLPQSDPANDDLNLKSYNIPDLSRTPVPFDADAIERIYRSGAAEEFN